jgi:hypothetical protein
MKSIIALLTVLIFITVISFVALSRFNGTALNERRFDEERNSSTDSMNYVALLKRVGEANEFCLKSKYNDSICFLINMSVHSGKDRFYVWDFKSNKAVDSGLVTHGCGRGSWGLGNHATDPPFSNDYDSHCSSPGKYKVGARDYSQWGIHVKYLLHGLDSTNSNALGRYIVLHSWDAIQTEPIYPALSPESWGCPAVSNAFMERLDEKLKSCRQPVLLWIFTSD